MIKTTFRLIRQLAYALLVAAMLVTSFGTPSYAAPASNEAIFYTEKNYQGDKYSYLKGNGDQATCQGEELELNDKFLSVEIGSLSKVLAWQHCNASGNYQEWTESKPDISSIEGLSRFKVVDTTDAVLAFRLIDDTNSTIPLSLSLKTFGLTPEGESIVDSTNDGNDDYRIIGVLPTNAGGEANVTAVYLRQAAAPYQDLSTGSVYFKWNATTNKVEQVIYGNEPPGFKIEQTSANTFDFRWVGV